MQVQREKQMAERRYGPPAYSRARPYNPMLELLEVQAGNKAYLEYSQDITNYLSILEPRSSINIPMIDLQPEIQWFMRPFLLDFLIELHTSFKLQPQTLFLCINIVDRYCSKRIVFKRHYQLVGCTALWIAGKYEDKKSRVPTLKELAMMCRNAYDEDMFVQMEMHILSTLEWSLGHPNLEDCLQIAISSCNIAGDSTPFKYNTGSKNASITSAVTAVGRFLCEMSLYNREFFSVPTSLVSISANLLACSMLQIPNASAYLLKIVSKDAPDDSFEFDEDAENRVPDVDGPFFGGYTEDTLHQIRRLCILFVLQLSRVTEVLTKKHEELGVIHVIRNFNKRYEHAIKIIHENQALIEDPQPEIFDSSFLSIIADSLLLLDQSSSRSNNEENHDPLTPPSASSQLSVFSNNASCSYETPMKGGQSCHSRSTNTDHFSGHDWSSPIAAKMHM